MFSLQTLRTRRFLGREACVRGADDPTELVRKPGRTRALPRGHRHPAGADHAGVIERRQQRCEPSGVRAYVVVEKHQVRAAGLRRAGVARPRRAAITLMVDDLDPVELGAQAVTQGAVVIDRDDHLAGRGFLLPRGVNCS